MKGAQITTCKLVNLQFTMVRRKEEEEGKEEEEEEEKEEEKEKEKEEDRAKEKKSSFHRMNPVFHLYSTPFLRWLKVELRCRTS